MAGAISGAIALAGLVSLSACGGSTSSSAGVASLTGQGTTRTTANANADGTGAASGTGNSKEPDTEQAMLDFAKCMREHGVDMPDPTFGRDGGGFNVSIKGPADGGDPASLDAAQVACQSYLDKVKSDAPPMDPAQIEEQKQKLLDFAQCMRDHGIDYPDPQISTSGGALQVKIDGGGADPNSPAFQDANDTCSKQVGLDLPKAGGAGPSTQSQVDSASDSGTSGQAHFGVGVKP
jgi:hypothetical protein